MTYTLAEKRYYGSPRWSGEITDCSMPITLDQYSKCSYNCFYCFSRFQKAIGLAKDNFLSQEVFPVNVNYIKDIFTGNRDSQFWPLIKEKKVIQWGGLSDPFCNLEKKFGVGLELLRFFASIDYPICFSTKGTWWLDDERYTELFRGRKNWNVKVSIITLDEDLRRLCEPGVPSSAARLDALRKISELECGGATLRLRPFIIGVSNPKHKDLILQSSDAGANAISTEFLCIEQRSTLLRKDLLKISGKVGFDLLSFYRRFSNSAGYLRLSRAVKKPFVDDMEDIARSVGMRFYVSDAHFKERCDNGSCCGLPPEWNYCRGQWTEILQIAKKREDGRVFWEDVEPHVQYMKGFNFCRAKFFNTKGSNKRSQYYDKTFYDFVKDIWNSPNNGQSPYRMYEGILKPIGVDENNDVVYEYDRSKE